MARVLLAFLASLLLAEHSHGFLVAAPLASRAGGFSSTPSASPYFQRARASAQRTGLRMRVGEELKAGEAAEAPEKVAEGGEESSSGRLRAALSQFSSTSKEEVYVYLF